MKIISIQNMPYRDLQLFSRERRGDRNMQYDARASFARFEQEIDSTRTNNNELFQRSSQRNNSNGYPAEHNLATYYQLQDVPSYHEKRDLAPLARFEQEIDYRTNDYKFLQRSSQRNNSNGYPAEHSLATYSQLQDVPTYHEKRARTPLARFEPEIDSRTNDYEFRLRSSQRNNSNGYSTEHNLAAYSQLQDMPTYHARDAWNRKFDATGTITELNNNSGLINDEVYFTRECYEGSLPLVGDRVIYDAKEFVNPYFNWIATRVRLISDQQQTSNNGWNTPFDDESYDQRNKQKDRVEQQNSKQHKATRAKQSGSKSKDSKYTTAAAALEDNIDRDRFNWRRGQPSKSQNDLQSPKPKPIWPKTKSGRVIDEEKYLKILASKPKSYSRRVPYVPNMEDGCSMQDHKLKKRMLVIIRKFKKIPEKELTALQKTKRKDAYATLKDLSLKYIELRRATIAESRL